MRKNIVSVFFLFSLAACTSVEVNYDSGEKSQASLPNEAPRRNQIFATVRQRMKSLRACYKTRKSEGAALEGSLTVGWDVLENGLVENLAVVEERTDLKDTKFIDCVLTDLKTWVFPKGNEEAKVILPLHIAPNGKEPVVSQ